MRILSLLLLAASTAQASVDWERVGVRDGVSVYRKYIPGTDLFAFKGDGFVDAPLTRIAAIIFDTQRSHEWIPDMVASRVLRWAGPHEFFTYSHVGTPIVIKDRDFVSRVRFEAIPEKRQLIFRFSPAPAGEMAETRYVRGELLKTEFVLTEQGARTHIQGEIHCDPKGSVPRWIVNLFQKDWPVKTLKGLRRQALKTDIVEDPRYARIFERGFSPRP
jgi:hypothetical protein